MIWRGFELGALVVGQLVSVRQVIRPTSSHVDSTTLQSCTCTQTRHNKPSHAHAPFPPSRRIHRCPHVPRIAHKQRKSERALKIHERLRQCNDPYHAAVNTARQVCIRPRRSRPNTCKLATQRDARRSARPALPFVYRSLPLSFHFELHCGEGLQMCTESVWSRLDWNMAIFFACLTRWGFSIAGY
jgi:hypothetical protein